MIDKELKKILFNYASDIMRIRKSGTLTMEADATRDIAIKQIKNLFDKEATSIEEAIAQLKVKYGN